MDVLDWSQVKCLPQFDDIARGGAGIVLCHTVVLTAILRIGVVNIQDNVTTIHCLRESTA